MVDSAAYEFAEVRRYISVRLSHIQCYLLVHEGCVINKSCNKAPSCGQFCRAGIKIIALSKVTLNTKYSHLRLTFSQFLLGPS